MRSLLIDRRAHAIGARRIGYRQWQHEAHELLAQRQRRIEQHISRSQDHGLDYGIDL